MNKYLQIEIGTNEPRLFLHKISNTKSISDDESESGIEIAQPKYVSNNSILSPKIEEPVMRIKNGDIDIKFNIPNTPLNKNLRL